MTLLINSNRYSEIENHKQAIYLKVICFNKIFLLDMNKMLSPENRL